MNEITDSDNTIKISAPDKKNESEKIRIYFKSIKKEAEKLYKIAEKARSKCVGDPKDQVEIPIATDVASRVEQLIGPEKISERIRELSKKFEREEVAFKIAAEIAHDKSIKKIDARASQAIRTALGILTEGITAAPLEGIADVKIKKNFDGTEYLAIYFAGPIRSAGGTEIASTVVIGDIVRKNLDLEIYKPINDEIERYVEELNTYLKKSPLQYPSTIEELKYAAQNIPVEITGEATLQEEVSGYKNLSRVETNKVRGGALLVLNDGILGKAPKLLKITEKRNISGWNWLETLASGKLRKKNQVIESKEEENKIEPKTKYLTDVIAGRPVLSYPSRKGGFRLRYGRARNTGFAALGMNPATMQIASQGFIASGTQFITERPGKGSIILPVDSIEGPLVLLFNNSVLRLNDLEQANKYQDQIKEIISMGDILIGYGEFLENNHKLIPSSYCEERWAEELKLKIKEKFKNISFFKKELNDFSDNIISFIKKPFNIKPNSKEAIKISEDLDVPLHPSYLFLWNDLSFEQLTKIYEIFQSSEIINNKLIIKKIDEIKKLLEDIEIPHEVFDDKIIFSEEISTILIHIFKLKEKIKLKIDENLSILENLSNFSGLIINNKSPYYIGGRMGRPEKAKERKMNPPVHSIFPIGLTGKSQRNIITAAKSGKTAELDLANLKCIKCGKISFLNKCPYCGGKTEPILRCSSCFFVTDLQKCPKCEGFTALHDKKKINLRKVLKNAMKNFKFNLPTTIKCVKGLINENKILEPLEKGILRAKNDIFVFRDGTCRFDATDAPLTHFKPNEISVSVKKMREIGFEKDVNENALIDGEQILEMKPQDILISKKAFKYIKRIADFVDDELEFIYDLPRYYNINNEEDLIGHLVVGIAPHISSAIVGRIIGFSEAQIGYAHPYFHAAKRRNCDSDEDAIILMLDALLNFSREYLPSTRGGMMDAPLVISLKLDPKEVDDEVHNMEIQDHFPLDFYKITDNYKHPKDALEFIEIIEKRLNTKNQFENFKYTHPVSNLNIGPMETTYKKIKDIPNKISAQLKVAEKIRAVDEADVARRIINTHFMRDIYGNLRAFSTQKYRCPTCNKTYRRVPINGRCDNVIKGITCNNKLILTVTEGGINKYLGVAKEMIEKYNLETYLKQRIQLAEDQIKSLFRSDLNKNIQKTLF
ncbi:MAG: DNA polymerase II large subunit [Candidatus Lokiarchaeota archaeon]|nr:DNA polymerase II large subunit [Candidatus Lokiarchaeota archaeon]